MLRRCKHKTSHTDR